MNSRIKWDAGTQGSVVRCEAGMHFRPNPGGESVVLGFLVGEQAFYDKMINHG